MKNKKRTAKERVRIIVSYIYIVLLFVVIGGGIGFYFANKVPVTYESKSLVYVVDENPSSLNNTVSLETIITHIKTRDLLDDVRKDLNLLYNHEEFLNILKVKILENTNFIEVKVTSLFDFEPKIIIETLFTKLEEKLPEFYPGISLKMVDKPIVSDVKSPDLLNIYLAIGMIIGGIVGSALVLMFGSVETYIKNHEDLKKYLNLKAIGIVPDYSVDEENPNYKKNKNKKDNNLVILEGSSIVSESYRIIRTNLDFLDLKVINFTSTTSLEGKSEAITNVALAFGLIGKKVLVIDCDLRKPVIHKRFNLNRGQGLSDVIIYNRLDEYRNYIQKYNIPDKEISIDVLSAGSKISNPSELLHSPRFSLFIEKIKQDYDLILIDCPPVSLMTDAVVVSKISDGTAYIIEYNKNNSDLISSSLEQLSDVGAFVVGGIITKVNIRKQKRLYGSKYEYYSNYI